MLQLVWIAVVRRDRLDVHRQLSRRPSDDLAIEVRWDRRQSERRAESQAGQTARRERRQDERRKWLPDTWRSLGFLLIPRTERLASERPSRERAGGSRAPADATAAQAPPEPLRGAKKLVRQRRLEARRPARDPQIRPVRAGATRLSRTRLDLQAEPARPRAPGERRIRVESGIPMGALALSAQARPPPR